MNPPIASSEIQPENHPIPARWLPVWSVVAAFGTYFCMYAFRKPFTAAGFEGMTYGGLGFKTILVTSQVFGYMISKFIGVKVVSELNPEHRSRGILALILAAQLSLILFAVIPAPYNAVMLFFNGLSLGMVFGLVVGFLEGRRNTEALTAGLCASFILADGMTKSVGGYLMKMGVDQISMPAVAGLLFLVPVFFFVWMLSKIPAPSAEDQKARNHRPPMNRNDRREFFRKYSAGLIPLMICYLLITVLRSIRADFATELWKDLGTTGQPSVFTRSEFYVTLFVMLSSGLFILIQNNRLAFFLALANSMIGSLLIIIATIGWHQGLIRDGFTLMVLLGLGLYLPYVSVHTTIFERFLAMTRDKGNIGYLMYLADAFGYLGYVAVMICRNYFGPPNQLLNFFLITCIVLGAISLLCLTISMIAFRKIKVVPAPV